MSANRVRGETTIKLGDGVDYVLRPSFEAIVGFEEQTGRGLFDLARSADTGLLTSTEAAIIVTHCVRAQGRALNDANLIGVNAKKIGALMLSAEGGLFLIMQRLNVLLFAASTGGYSPTGEVQAARDEATPTAA
jgi:hypothetical protein